MGLMARRKSAAGGLRSLDFEISHLVALFLIDPSRSMDDSTKIMSLAPRQSRLLRHFYGWGIESVVPPVRRSAIGLSIKVNFQSVQNIKC